MRLDIDVSLTCRVEQPVDMILQIRAPDFADQRVLSESYQIGLVSERMDVAAEAGLGERTLLRTSQGLDCAYAAQFEIDRPTLDIASLDNVPPHLLPGDVVRYLMPSRYCPADELQSFVAAEFGHQAAGARIAAMRDWISERFSYAPGTSNAQTTAIDTFVQRQGVCRDFAHVLITLARAAAIPARFVSAYAPQVIPQDLHAVVEVYLDGTWHLLDATGMATAADIVRIGVGMDAAEVAFLSSFGPMTLTNKSVAVSATDAPS